MNIYHGHGLLTRITVMDGAGAGSDSVLADINNDTFVDISDVILTLRMALGLDPLEQCT